MVKKIDLLLGLIVVSLFFSCSSRKKVLYLQDMNTTMPIEQQYEIYIQKDDLLGILVNCKEQELAIPFNLPRVSYDMGDNTGMDVTSTMSSGSNDNSNQLGYVVDSNGDIDFPILGKLHVVGLTRMQLKSLIENRLREEDLIKDAIVTIQFLNFKIYMLGEVSSPGVYKIDNERVTLLEAISMAGDLTINGCRDKVVVIREKNGKRTKYYTDLRSKDLFNSPCFYLQQNDIVYVEPNKNKANASQSARTNFSFATSIISTALTIGTLVLSLINIFN